jgi:hypothetical protein
MHAVRVAVVSVGLALLWLTATVYRNYGGNWTGIYCFGETYAIGAETERLGVYKHPGSFGYDGQIYFLMAQDPFLRGEPHRYVDFPRLRYRRILIPLAARIAALGNDAALVATYLGVMLAFLALGAWSAARWAELRRHSCWIGLLFLLVPGVAISIDRMTVDLGLAALTMTAIYAWNARLRKLLLLSLALAPLVRETGLLLIAGFALVSILNRKWRDASGFVACAAPAAAWFVWVHLRTQPMDYANTMIPMASILKGFYAPAEYPPGLPWRRLWVFADLLALVGVVYGFYLALRWWKNWREEPLRAAALLFALMGMTLQRDDHWWRVYDFGRVYTPMMIILMTDRESHLIHASPAMLMWPRIGLQVGRQILGILGLPLPR